jgi:RimJ/RimL family protein N-acetyltransferase
VRRAAPRWTAFQRTSRSNGFGLFAAELRATGEFIGFIGLSRVPFEAHVTLRRHVLYRARLLQSQP